jgi:5-methylcytosine-specific restriction endonuclease McrA
VPFFQVDDRLHVNRKARELAQQMLAGDPLGLAALGLWTLAGSQSQDEGTDGVVSAPNLITVVYDLTAGRELARRLVDAGLWHEAGHDCPRCEPVPVGSWRFHDWWALGYDKAATVRETRAKRKELQDPATVNAVWLRDCVDPLDPTRKGHADCRYCGRLVKRNDRSSKDENARATLDHVDPYRAAGVRNLVVACSGCNRTKGRRTPAEAGMTLRPAPRALTDEQERAAGVVSQGTTLSAETTPAPPVDQAAASAEQQPTGASSARAVLEHCPEGVLGRTRGPAPVRGSGTGSGSGVGLGSGEGSPPAPASGGRRRSRNRRRGRGRAQHQTETRQPESTDAGPAPAAPEVGRYGSPWFGHSGPSSPLGAENHCPEHQLPEPCRKCTQETR